MWLMAFNPEELDKEKDVVQMIQGEENVVPLNLYCYSSSQKIIDAYSEASGAYVLFNYPEFQKKHIESLSRGVRVRVLTEITRENLPYVREALQRYISDIRHLDTITHHFAVSEKHFLSCKVVYGNPDLTQCIFSNIGWFVRENQYVFEKMWEKAIPLKQRIREIEEGQKREFVDTIREPVEVLNLLPNMVSSAYEEIMLLFPNLNALRGFESAGLFESIKDHIVKNNNVRVRLMLKDPQHHDYSDVKGTSSGDDNTNIFASDISSSNNKPISQTNVEVKFASPDKIDTNTALVIVDNEKMVAIEFDEEKSSSTTSPPTTQPNLPDSFRFATHTNSESAIMSHISIFERLWIESEIRQH